MLIQWKGKPVEEATWEEEFTMTSQFPNLRLDDKPKIQRGGIDRSSTDVMGLDNQNRPKVWRVYARKNRRGGKNDEVAERERDQ